MNTFQKLFIFFFSFQILCFAQNPLKKCKTKIDNDLYFLTIDESLGGYDANGNLTKGLSVKKISTKNVKSSFEFENYSLEKILEHIYEDNNILIKNSLINQKMVHVAYKNKTLEEDEAKIILWSNLAFCFGLKQTAKSREIESWVWELKDSTQLAKVIHKENESKEKSWKTGEYFLFGEDRWESKGYSIDFAVKDLAHNLKISIENRIQSKELFDFVIQLPPPISFENVRKQLDSYGISMKKEKTEKKIIEIE